MQFEKFIKVTATESSLRDALKKIDIKINAWKAESIYQVLELFSLYDENISLRKIISNIEVEIQM